MSEQAVFRTKDGKVNLSKAVKGTKVKSDKVLDTLSVVLSILVVGGTVWSEVSSDYYLSRGLFKVLEPLVSIRSSNLKAGDVVVVSNKNTQMKYRGLQRVTAYSLELQKINEDGTTQSCTMTVPYDVYFKVNIGEKFVYDENGELQPQEW